MIRTASSACRIFTPDLFLRKPPRLNTANCFSEFLSAAITWVSAASSATSTRVPFSFRAIFWGCRGLRALRSGCRPPIPASRSAAERAPELKRHLSAARDGGHLRLHFSTPFPKLAAGCPAGVLLLLSSYFSTLILFRMGTRTFLKGLSHLSARWTRSEKNQRADRGLAVGELHCF